LELKGREGLARKEAIAISNAAESDDEGIVVPGTPPMLIGESQGGTTMTLAVRPSPEKAQRISPPVPAASPFFRLFSSTAPARVEEEEEEEGRGKRRRIYTDRYEISKAQGDIDESQHGK
jgi:hypothetical protein